MPTCDRPELALRAVDYFLRQTYPARELLVVGDGEDGLRERLPVGTRVRYVVAPRGEPIGAKRELACAAARGQFVAHWDDDDWHGAERLERQLAPLLRGEADMTALTDPVILDLEQWQFWRWDEGLRRRLLVHDVLDGTLVFRRSVWQRLARYPARSRAGDVTFLKLAVRRGARLHALPADGVFLYVRHGGNDWRFLCGHHLRPAGWRRVDEPPLPPPDRAFYAALSPAHRHARRRRRLVKRRPPLVTCVMPTRGRHPWVAQAVRYFERQSYDARELVVVDDGVEPVRDLLPDDSRVRYVRLERPAVLGHKRNVGCALAEGTLIAHWDDDDWYARDRLRYQVAELERSGAGLCGASGLLFHELGSDRAWRFQFPSARRRLIGTTLLYRRDVWARRPFEPLAAGEDARFVRRAACPEVLALTEDRFCVGIIHGGNTSPKRTREPGWQTWPAEDVRRALGADYTFYAGLDAGGRARSRRVA
jgi:glycosyltransferase involved in cell wall biosynthesis